MTMKKITLSVLAASTMFVACKQTTTPTSNSISASVDNYALPLPQAPVVPDISEADIKSLDTTGVYASFMDDFTRYEKVYEANKAADESAKNLSTKFYAAGMQNLYTKKDIRASIPYLVKATLANPNEAKYFYELGNALHEYSKEAYYSTFRANDVYNYAEKRNYEPARDLAYRQAVNNYGADEMGSSESIKYFIKWLPDNFDLALRITQDTMMKEYSYPLKDALLEKFKGSANSFQVFLADFKPLQLPYTVTKDMMMADFYLENEGYVSLWDRVKDKPSLTTQGYMDFIPGLDDADFGRESEDSYLAEGIVRHTDQYTALLYIKMVNNAEWSPLYYIIRTYDNAGKGIDELKLAERINVDMFSAGTIKSDYAIEINQYKNKWKDDISTVTPYDNKNKLLASTVIGTKRYKISDEGKFVKENSLLGMK